MLDKKRDFNKKKFWIKKYEKFKDEIFSKGFIESVNMGNFKNNKKVFDLKKYSEHGCRIKDKEIIDMFEGFYRFEYRPFLGKNGRVITQNEHESFIKNMGIKWTRCESGEVEHIVSFGIVRERCNIKSYPTKINAYKDDKDKFNRFIETSLYFGEGVMVLKESVDKQWLLVMSKDYIGWAVKGKIMKCSSDQFYNFLNEEKFVISVGNNNSCKIDGESVDLPLGCKVPFLNENKVCFEGYLPYIEDGVKKKKTFGIGKEGKYSEGYLEFNKKNTISLAFEMLGEEYSWGGEDRNRDCSSYVRDIYGCFGLIMPRNAGDQSRLMNIENISLVGLDRDEKIDVLNNKSICLPIYMNGHVMIYLGEFEGEGYIIHDCGGYYKNGVRICESEVVVSDIEIETSEGKIYHDEFTLALVRELKSE